MLPSEKIKVPRMPSREASNLERGVFPKDMASTLDLSVSLELACQHGGGWGCSGEF